MNPFLATDGYKTGHHLMYPPKTSLVYSNFTPRSHKYAPKGINQVVSFGQQMVMKQIHDMFDKHFFNVISVNEYGNTRLKTKKEICGEIEREYSLYLGAHYDVSHIEDLWDYGFLPIKVKAIPEGSLVPIGVPVLTIYNTEPRFYWLTNFLETLISNLLWKPMTSATIALQYKRIMLEWAKKTDPSNLGLVDFIGHDFSMRGLDSIDATISSGLGHALSFKGSDSLPVIHGARKYYYANDFVVGSVNATEHSVMSAGGKESEIETFRRLMKQFPTGILSIVSDTWDLWKVLSDYLPILKDEIMERDGKIVIRPDSGDPADILCGVLDKYKDVSEYIDDDDSIADMLLDEVRAETPHGECGDTEYENTYIANGKLYKIKIDNIEWNRHDKQYYYIDMYSTPSITKEEFEITPEHKGVIRMLWELFGGTINENGFKVLDSHIGTIYGDSITLKRCNDINQRLAAQGFATTNWVAGIGSFTYQFNTRDTFGFAMKATYTETTDMDDKTNDLKVTGKEIFKDPVTGDNTKKSAKGLLRINLNQNGEYELEDQVSWDAENGGCLHVIYEDGEFHNEKTFSEIRYALLSYQ